MKQFRLINSGRYLYPNGKYCLKNSVIQALKMNESKAFGYISFSSSSANFLKKYFIILTKAVLNHAFLLSIQS